MAEQFIHTTAAELRDRLDSFNRLNSCNKINNKGRAHNYWLHCVAPALRQWRQFGSPDAWLLEEEGVAHLIENQEAYPTEENETGYSAGEVEVTISSALSQQVGGSHYKSLPIQPVEYCQRNKLGFCESSAIKYISRWKDKGGIQDIDKAIHFLNLLKEIESKDDENNSL